MDRESLHRRAREKGANPIVYWIVRAFMQPFFHTYWRLRRIGREHIPDGPVIFAANHRSFLDPFVIAVLARRPIYYVAKRELFESGRLQAWFLNALGAFPIDRGAADEEAIKTAKAILARGDSVLIFPEGTRVRPGPLGRPKRGVARLALEMGVPVVPVAVLGTEAIRTGWRIRPHKVRIRVGPALRFPRVENATPQLAQGVTERIWACVALQWEWLGGMPPLRRAAVVGDTDRARELAGWLAKGGVEVQQGKLVDVSEAELVCFACSPSTLAAAVASHADRIPARAGVLVCAQAAGVPPMGTLASAYVSERVRARPVAVLTEGDQPAVASLARPFARQVAAALNDAGVPARTTTEVTAAELGPEPARDRERRAAAVA